MKLLRALLVIAALAALLSPELPRYAAERRVGEATAAFRSLLDRADDPATAAASPPWVTPPSPSRAACRAIPGPGSSEARRIS